VRRHAVLPPAPPARRALATASGGPAKALHQCAAPHSPSAVCVGARPSQLAFLKWYSGAESVPVGGLRLLHDPPLKLDRMARTDGGSGVYRPA